MGAASPLTAGAEAGEPEQQVLGQQLSQQLSQQALRCLNRRDSRPPRCPQPLSQQAGSQPQLGAQEFSQPQLGAWQAFSQPQLGAAQQPLSQPRPQELRRPSISRFLHSIRPSSSSSGRRRGWQQELQAVSQPQSAALRKVAGSFAATRRSVQSAQQTQPRLLQQLVPQPACRRCSKDRRQLRSRKTVRAADPTVHPPLVAAALLAAAAALHCSRIAAASHPQRPAAQPVSQHELSQPQPSDRHAVQQSPPNDGVIKRPASGTRSECSFHRFSTLNDEPLTVSAVGRNWCWPDRFRRTVAAKSPRTGLAMNRRSSLGSRPTRSTSCADDGCIPENSEVLLSICLGLPH